MKPEEVAETVAKVLYDCMVKAGAYFCTRCKLDADVSRNSDGTLPTHWVHWTMEKEQLFKAITDNMLETFIKKNHDYGNSFDKQMDEFGMTAAIIRLSDKLNRLKVLSKDDALVKDESIQDTLLDLANYSILTAMWLYDQK